MDPTILYTACLLGAVGLYLLLRPGQPGTHGIMRARSLKTLGAVLGFGVLGWMLMQCAEAVGVAAGRERPEVFFTVFGIIAVFSAVKMITHSRPVYSALFFVLVVLSSAGLFLLLEAEFMAFAMIIVYAGAILITYMFVLMLVQQAPNPDIPPGDPAGQPDYDREPRDPAMGAIVGFLLLALLSRMVLDGTGGLPEAPHSIDARNMAWDELRQLPRRIENQVAIALAEQNGGEPVGAIELVRENGAVRLDVTNRSEQAVAWYRIDGGEPAAIELPASAMPENVQRVGLGLMGISPFSLELAGVILLMAMLGAVILARRQIELTEDETREAAGMRRLGHHDDPAPDGAGGVGTGGAAS